ncbi:iron ABC transporter permease [Anaerotignum sp.]|uniref:FecCD family ABC transporter permease n=1 Tax=Anaerotignum sp. TaxID=2039241 RepID=UPI00332C96AF
MIKSKEINFKVSALFILIPIFVALVCLGFGRYSISVPETVDVLLKGFKGEGTGEMAYSVIFNVRLPRIILAMLVGAGLACAGAAFQGLFTNPLATPDTLGVASGASFGAVFAMMFDANLVVIQLLALVFGLISCLITYNISKIKGKSSIVMIVLAGMVVSAMFQAFVSLLKYVADPQDKLPSITYWLMGSMSAATYKTLILGSPFIIIGIILIFALRWRLNILSLNEDEAKSMGMNIKILRLLIILSASLITASCVSMCGQVGWVGLLIPHLARMMMGSNNKTVIPISISLGAVFMMVIDTFARSATAAEIPLSILTAIIGAPFFIALLRRTGGAWS